MSSSVVILKRFLTPALVCVLAACGGGSSSDSDSPSPPAGPQVKLSGTISYTRVPSAADGLGLDYDNAIDKPARGVVVEALAANNAVLDATITDASGAYSLSVSEETDVRVRAKAQLLKSGTPGWDVTVTDNTNGNAPYFLTGALANSGTQDSGRDLLAASGWGGNSYTGLRAAAPFAILDTIYDTQQAYLDAQPGTVFEPLELRWSENNKPTSGSEADGDIGTSFYDTSLQAIYILGFEDSDTDEYDESVVSHEWWHYAEDVLLRSENIGGPHGGGDRLDMRVAFSEGIANAWSALVTDTQFYTDSGGPGQAQGFSISLENDNVLNPGWYSEGSVQSIFHDLLDSGASDDDNLSLTPATVLTALATEHKQSPAFASIFTFIKALKNQSAVDASTVDQLVAAQSIVSAGNDEFGSDETNSAGSSQVLPIYSDIVIDSPAASNVCSVDDFGTVNKLSNYRFLRFSITNTANYRISVARTSGLQPSDPDFTVYLNGKVKVRAAKSDDNEEQATVELAPGLYVMDLAEYRNTDDSVGGETCFDVRVEAQ